MESTIAIRVVWILTSCGEEHLGIRGSQAGKNAGNVR